jgi:uncharacterized protein
VIDLMTPLSRIAPAQRILLLPHCLRQSNNCSAGYNQDGLQCRGCSPECAVNRLRTVALDAGYQAVCVAPGGKLALKFIKKKKPAAIVAVACDKELAEGLRGVQDLEPEAINPVMVVVPLRKDGCVDTEVDIEEAIKIIRG